LNGAYQHVNRLGVQVAAEALKLRRDKHGVSVVNLARGAATSGSRSSDGSVRPRDLVERSLGDRRPSLERYGCHEPLGRWRRARMLKASMLGDREAVSAARRSSSRNQPDLGTIPTISARLVFGALRRTYRCCASCR
jgi:hypothetical protein